MTLTENNDPGSGPRVSILVARDHNYAIGKNNDLPWRLSSDLRRFKRLTWGQPIVMGRKTHESIGKTLPGRVNIVVSRNANYTVARGAKLAFSYENALELARDACECGDIFIIGGTSLYEAALMTADRIYETLVDTKIQNADAFLPRYNADDFIELVRETGFKNKGDEYHSLYRVLKRVCL